MVSGVIAEFNIFHNGHKYLLCKARKNSDGIIAVMSGSFVQRGDVAAADKWIRARCALLNGADLVIELPVCYALNAAPNFAEGAVRTLDALGIVDTLVFGCESDAPCAITEAAYMLENEQNEESALIKKYLAEGIPYPAAISKAYGGKIDSAILSEPNNILAVEYCRSILRCGSGMTVRPVTRHAVSHDAGAANGSYASASHIRGMMASGSDFSGYVPYDPDSAGIRKPFLLSRLDSAVIAKLRTTSADQLRCVSEVSEGLENRILSAAMRVDSFFQLAQAVKCKRYTMSRIRRILIASLIGFTKDIYSPQPEYIRVLGFNKTGAALLKEIKKNSRLPIVTKVTSFGGKSKMLALDMRATDIAMLCAPENRNGGADYTREIVREGI